MNSTLEKLIQALPQMTPAQLAEVQARTGALLGGRRTVSPSGKRSRSEAPEIREVHTLVSEHIKNLGAEPAPFVALQRHAIYGEFAASVPAIHAYITAHFKPANEGERHKALRIITGMAADHVARFSKAPLSTVTVARALTNFSGIIERQFPGYKAAGLLPMVLTHRGHADPGD